MSLMDGKRWDRIIGCGWSGMAYLFRRVLGGILFFLYVALWIYGYVSPLCFVYWMVTGWYVPAMFMFLLGIVPYFVDVKPSQLWRNLLYNGRFYFRSYAVEFDEKLGNRDKPFLLCVAPHGIFCSALGILATEQEFSHVRFLMAPLVYYAPFFNFLMLRTVGNFGSVSPAELRRRMESRENLAIVPGGIEESTIHSKAVNRIFLRSRKGFVKYALRYGYDLVPVWVDGESQTYFNAQGGWAWRLALNRHKLPAVAAFGAWFCPIMPNPSVDLKAHVGTPIVLPRIENPTEADIDMYHTKYASALVELYLRNNDPSLLEIW
mmetsp:Transcript_2993/g.5740  ORF Transcript_2993/g.5740 Transcript_2993/m.5740 type:complete len:320 (+) Transcript_2993:164-1123(+)